MGFFDYLRFLLGWRSGTSGEAPVTVTPTLVIYGRESTPVVVYGCEAAFLVIQGRETPTQTVYGRD